MANINNTSSYLLKFQPISLKQASLKDSTRKCKSMTFKRNLMQWVMKNKLQKIYLTYITLKKKLFFISESNIYYYFYIFFIIKFYI